METPHEDTSLLKFEAPANMPAKFAPLERFQDDKPRFKAEAPENMLENVAPAETSQPLMSALKTMPF